jgi:hypothetical protein
MQDARGIISEMQVDEKAREAKVLEAIWPWRTKISDGTKAVTKISRKRVLVESAIVLSLGLLIRLYTEKYIIGTIVLCIASLTLVSGLCLHPLYRVLQRVGKFLAKWLGLIVTWLLLVPFFYFTFPIGRLLFVISGKDLLCSKFPGDEKSYWTKWSNPKSKEQYRKQF